MQDFLQSILNDPTVKQAVSAITSGQLKQHNKPVAAAPMHTKPAVDVADILDPRPQEAIQNPTSFTPQQVGQNAVSDIGGIVTGLAKTPGRIVSDIQHPEQITPDLENLAKGAGTTINDALGKPINTQTGSLQEPSAYEAAQNLFQHPVNDALLLSPAKVGNLGKTAEEAAPVASEGVSADATIPKTTRVTVKPSYYGAGKEAAIQDTVNNVVPGATAAEKYANLNKTMSDLGDQIQTKLQENPQDIPISTIKADLTANLGDQITSGNISAKTAQNEVEGFLTDLDIKGTHSDLPGGETINSTDLFQLKQKINDLYQGIAKKEANGTPLNPREQVIAVARKTLDDTISSYNPEVKELTTQQSHLYDAAPSLFKGREAEIAEAEKPTGLQNGLTKIVKPATAIGSMFGGTPGALFGGAIDEALEPTYDAAITKVKSSFGLNPKNSQGKGGSNQINNTGNITQEGLNNKSNSEINQEKPNANSINHSNLPPLPVKVGLPPIPTVAHGLPPILGALNNSVPNGTQNGQENSPQDDGSHNPAQTISQPITPVKYTDIPSDVKQIKPSPDGSYPITSPNMIIDKSGQPLAIAETDYKNLKKQYQSALADPATISNPFQKAQIQSKLDQLETTYTQSKELQDNYTGATNVGNAASTAMEMLKDAPPSLFNQNGLVSNYNTLLNGKYAGLQESLDILGKYYPVLEKTFLNAPNPQAAQAVLAQINQRVAQDYYQKINIATGNLPGVPQQTPQQTGAAQGLPPIGSLGGGGMVHGAPLASF